MLAPRYEIISQTTKFLKFFGEVSFKMMPSFLTVFSIVTIILFLTAQLLSQSNDLSELKYMIAVAYTRFCDANKYLLKPVNDHRPRKTVFDSNEVPSISIQGYVNEYVK